MSSSKTRPLLRAAALASLAGAACSLASLDGLSDGVPPSPVADGGTDGGAMDAVGVADGAVPFCERHVDAALCSSFDAPTGNFAGWEDRSDNGGSVIIDQTTAVSPPGSLHALAPSLDAVAQLQLEVPPMTKGIRTSFAIKVTPPTLSGNERVGLVSFVCSDDDGAYDGAWLSFAAVGGQTQLVLLTEEGRTARVIDGFSSDWRRITLEVVLDGPAPSAKALLDGVESTTANVTAGCSSYPHLRLEVGASASFAGPIDVHYDDILVELDR